MSDGYQIARDFLDQKSAGILTDDILAPDLEVWTVDAGGGGSRKEYQNAIRALKTIFVDGPHYEIQSITAEEDRVAIQAHGSGTTIDGSIYDQSYLFLLRVRHGAVISLHEFFNQDTARRIIMPLLQIAMTRQSREDGTPT